MFNLLNKDIDEVAVEEVKKVSARLNDIKDLMDKIDDLLWQKYNFEIEENKKWGSTFPDKKDQLMKDLGELEKTFRDELLVIDTLRKQENN